MSSRNERHPPTGSEQNLESQGGSKAPSSSQYAGYSSGSSSEETDEIALRVRALLSDIDEQTSSISPQKMSSLNQELATTPQSMKKAPVTLQSNIQSSSASGGTFSSHQETKLQMRPDLSVRPKEKKKSRKKSKQKKKIILSTQLSSSSVPNISEKSKYAEEKEPLISQPLTIQNVLGLPIVSENISEVNVMELAAPEEPSTPVEHFELHVCHSENFSEDYQRNIFSTPVTVDSNLLANFERNTRSPTDISNPEDLPYFRWCPVLKSQDIRNASTQTSTNQSNEQGTPDLQDFLSQNIFQDSDSAQHLLASEIHDVELSLDVELTFDEDSNLVKYSHKSTSNSPSDTDPPDPDLNFASKEYTTHSDMKIQTVKFLDERMIKYIQNEMSLQPTEGSEKPSEVHIDKSDPFSAETKIVRIYDPHQSTLPVDKHSSQDKTSKIVFRSERHNIASTSSQTLIENLNEVMYKSHLECVSETEDKTSDSLESLHGNTSVSSTQNICSQSFEKQESDMNVSSNTSDMKMNDQSNKSLSDIECGQNDTKNPDAVQQLLTKTGQDHTCSSESTPVNTSQSCMKLHSSISNKKMVKSSSTQTNLQDCMFDKRAIQHSSTQTYLPHNMPDTKIMKDSSAQTLIEGVNVSLFTYDVSRNTPYLISASPSSHIYLPSNRQTSQGHYLPLQTASKYTSPKTSMEFSKAANSSSDIFKDPQFEGTLKERIPNSDDSSSSSEEKDAKTFAPFSKDTPLDDESTETSLTSLEKAGMCFGTSEDGVRFRKNVVKSSKEQRPVIVKTENLKKISPFPSDTYLEASTFENVADAQNVGGKAHGVQGQGRYSSYPDINLPGSVVDEKVDHVTTLERFNDASTIYKKDDDREKLKKKIFKILEEADNRRSYLFHEQLLKELGQKDKDVSSHSTKFHILISNNQQTIVDSDDSSLQYNYLARRRRRSRKKSPGQSSQKTSSHLRPLTLKEKRRLEEDKMLRKIIIREKAKKFSKMLAKSAAKGKVNFSPEEQVAE